MFLPRGPLGQQQQHDLRTCQTQILKPSQTHNIRSSAVEPSKLFSPAVR